MRELNAVKLRDYLASTTSEPLLLDVREPWEFQTCQIEGSQLIPMGKLPALLNTLDPTRETVVICHHGIRSRQVARFLEYQGFTSVINLSDGIDGWSRDVDHEMATY